ncbi:hypothetical protein Angca_006777 [Angiostrongylus cantonensis]|nr:hypothetical protein Angca_006777 [Angiostrongylus cantonensis]
MSQALDTRDAVAMTLYEVLFSWIVNRISSHFKCADHNAVISVIDCYGIERYNNNGFEQLLINTVNEKLENAFVKHTFLNEVANYASEGLIFDWKIPSTLENDKVIDLLCRKPNGLLHLINDECKFPKTSDESYLRHCNLNHLDKSVYGKAKNKDKQQLSIRHSFGTTWYNVHGFVQRNRRSLPIQIASVLSKSQNTVISMLFRSIVGDRENADYTVYAANQFNTSSTALTEKILSSQSHFVRCLKSNNERRPASLDTATLARQLKAFSVLETLYFRQIGFPLRIPFKRFMQSYRCLLPSEIALCQNQKEIIVDILDGQGVKFANDFRIGTSYVFLRDRLANQLQTTSERIQHDAAYVIQKTIRMYVVRKGYLRKRNAVVRIQAGVRGWKARKESCILREQTFKQLSSETKLNHRLSVYHEALMSGHSNQKCSSALLGCFDVNSMTCKEIGNSLKRSKPVVESTKTTTDYLPLKLKSHIDTVEPVSIEEFAVENFKGIENPCQRDEIFVQLCNQIHRNPDKEAQSRCCRLLLHAVGTFAPTKVVLPMLISFCNQQRSSLQTQLLNTIARRMTISNYEIARLLPASVLEMSAIYNLRNPAVEVTSQDGQTHVVEAHSWITSEKLVNTVLQHRGIGNPNGWSVEVEAKKMVYHPTGAHFLHDVISEIELGKEENKKLVESFFFNYPNEKTLPPMNAKKTDLQIGHTQCKMSPVVKRHMRQLCNESREMSRSLDVMNTSRGSISRSQHGSYTDISHGSGCAEYIPSGSPRPPTTGNMVTVQIIRFATFIRPTFKTLQAQRHARWNERTPRRGSTESVLRNKHSMLIAPMVQYVPLMVTPQPAVLTTHMNQKIQTTMHPSLPVPATNFYHGAHYIEQRAQKQLSASHSNYLDEYSRNHSKSSSEERTHDVNAIKSVSQPKFDSLRSGSSAATQGGGCDSRILNSRCDYVPSVHSTMSVASQIRNMPVPNSNRDLDRFLDEVFDQVLSPHDLAAEMNAHEIASSVKGGAYGSTSCQICIQSPSTMLNVVEYTEHPPWIYRRRKIYHFYFVFSALIGISNLYLQEGLNDPYLSDFHIMREYVPTSAQCTPSMQRSWGNSETVMSNSSLYEPQQMVFMMPVQMSSSVGQVIPVLMTPGMIAPSVTPNTMDSVSSNTHKMMVSPRQRRNRSLDARPAINGDVSTYQPCMVTNSSLSTHSSRQGTIGTSKSMFGLMRPEQSGLIPRPPSRANPSVNSLTSERRQNGLNRIQQQSSRETIVQNTIINSEHPNPQKFRIAEKNLVKEIQEKEREALQKIKDRLKNQRSRSQTEWVFENDVEQSTELERPRSAAFTSLVKPQKYHADSVNSQQKPAVRYVKQPWKLTIRKEMFHPQEVLDDVNVINQVFAQIISDCRKGIAYHIRTYERDDVVNILKAENIPPELLERQAEIPVDVKVAVISAARKWPLYFMQVYEAVEERIDESVSVLLSISEHGVRLILHTPLDKENPLKVQDHLDFSDLSTITVENDGLLCLHTRNGMIIRLRTKMALQIKEQIDKCMFGQIQHKQFVRATSDYITKQSNLLSFKKGDTIELIPLPTSELTPSGSWFYGKIGNRYGSLSAQYVVPLDENNREVDESFPILPLIYDSFIDDGDHMNGYKYTMFEFALNHFRGPKGFENTLKKNRKEWTWNDIAQKIKFTDKPISHSLIRFDSSELDKLACETFLCIMRYMGDEPIRRGETVTDSVYCLLLICHKNPALRDEVYCQVIRQTTNNKSSKQESSIRGWRLLSILTAYFDCSLALRPYLVNYLVENANDHRRAYHGTAQICLQNLNQTIRYGGRKYLLSGMEVEEITNGKILKRQVYSLPGGMKKVINTRSVTVVEEAIRELCLKLNIRSPSEQQEFCLAYFLEKEKRLEYCANNEYVLDICTELEHKRKQFYFLLKRCTWVHPVRLDDQVYIDVMFFQVVPDYLLGSYLTRQVGGHLSASTCEDITRLAAYLHLAFSEGQRVDVTPSVCALS